MGENGKVGTGTVEGGNHVPNQSPLTEDDVAPAHSKRSPAFQFYPAEFLASRKVDRMSMTERGAYITLLCQCWLDNGLPTDLGELAESVRMKPEQFRRMWESGKIRHCFIERGGKLHNERLDVERKKQVDYRRRQADNGSKGGRPIKATVNPPLSDSKALISSDLISSDLDSSRSVGTERQQPIIRKRRMDAAYEHESGMYVPQRAHDDLLPMHAGRERELFDWYPVICDTWKGRTTGANMIAFWKARHDETWPPEQSAKPSNKPSWYKGGAA